VRQLLPVLPLIAVMVAGPQIVSAIFLATSEHWARNSAAFIGGAALSITLVTTIAFVIARLAGGAAGGASHSLVRDGIDIAVVILLVILAAMVLRRRGRSQPPRWMGRLQTATALLSFTLGFLLLGVFPSDVITSIAVGTRIAAHGGPWWHTSVFVLFTLLLLAMPVLLTAAAGQRAVEILPKVRDWMNRNSWVVSEAVIIFFLALTIAGLAGH
jgi:cytochrome c biogenesis protein CcdA